MSNSIHRCPNCNYMLVLLETRRKFKCAKCGKLFPQKDIEAESFRIWNEKQKEIERHNLRIENKRTKLSEEEKQQRKEEYIEKNKDKIKLKEQRWRDTNREHYNKSKMLYYHKNLKQSRHLMRMKYWRQKQVILAQGELEKIDLKSHIS